MNLQVAHLADIRICEVYIKEMIKEELVHEKPYQHVKECLQYELEGSMRKNYILTIDGMFNFKDKWYVLCMSDLKKLIMDDFHKIPYLGHTGYLKMITTMKNKYYWLGMKKKVVDYISGCLECQQVKVECIHTTVLVQPIAIPMWKWEVISMDFITRFPKTSKHNHVIMVVVKKMKKEAHFIVVKSSQVPLT